MKNFSTAEFKKNFYIYYFILILKRRKQQPWSKWGRDSHFVRLYLTQSHSASEWKGLNVKPGPWTDGSLDLVLPGVAAVLVLIYGVT